MKCDYITIKSVVTCMYVLRDRHIEVLSTSNENDIFPKQKLHFFKLIQRNNRDANVYLTAEVCRVMLISIV
jgi:hypothetical protein